MKVSQNNIGVNIYCVFTVCELFMFATRVVYLAFVKCALPVSIRGILSSAQLAMQPRIEEK